MTKKEAVRSVLTGIAVLAVGLAAYLLLSQKPESVVIQSLSSPTNTPKVTISPSPTPTPTPDVTLGWEKYDNPDGGYEFRHPSSWNVVIHPNTEKGALFGPGAALSGSDGSIEPVGMLEPGQSLKDFVKNFNQEIESGSASETETVINGRPAVVSILPKSGEGNMEIKNVSFEKNNNVFNISLLYHADTSKYPADKKMLDTFNKLLTTFKFID